MEVLLLERAEVRPRLAHHDRLEPRHVLFVNHPVAVDTFRLVRPQPSHLERRREPRSRAPPSEALEDGGHCAEVPLVVELDRRREELVGDRLMHSTRRVDDRTERIAYRLLEDFEMAAHDARVDMLEDGHVREGCRERGKVTLQPVGHREAPGARVERRHVLYIREGLHRELLQVEESAIVELLSEELDGRLGAVLVGRRHVQIVHKVHQPLRPRGAEERASLLLERLLEHELQVRRICVRVEVDAVLCPRVLVELAEERRERHRLGTQTIRE